MAHFLTQLLFDCAKRSNSVFEFECALAQALPRNDKNTREGFAERNLRDVQAGAVMLLSQYVDAVLEERVLAEMASPEPIGALEE